MDVGRVAPVHSALHLTGVTVVYIVPQSPLEDEVVGAVDLQLHRILTDGPECSPEDYVGRLLLPVVGFVLKLIQAVVLHLDEDPLAGEVYSTFHTGSAIPFIPVNTFSCRLILAALQEPVPVDGFGAEGSEILPLLVWHVSGASKLYYKVGIYDNSETWLLMASSERSIVNEANHFPVLAIFLVVLQAYPKVLVPSPPRGVGVLVLTGDVDVGAECFNIG